MKEEYLFVFGYEPPEYRPYNSRAGSDPQLCTGVFRIVAESEREALAWGRELARWYVDELFGKGIGNWSDTVFASWIEQDANKELGEFAHTLPIVDFGKYPDINVFRKAFSD